MHCQAPGRICLFGEHQDYLGFPVIAGAVDLYFHFQGERRDDGRFVIHKRDFHKTEIVDLPARGLLPYRKKRDYFRSSLNVLMKQGIPLPFGADVEIWSEVPIAAGAGSSSVMLVAWLRFLTELYGRPERDDPVRLAEMAFTAEVSEFQEPGGKMDHYTASLGGLQFLDFSGGIHRRLRERMGGFVIVDSLDKKDTLGGLRYIKEGEIRSLELVRERYPGRPLQELEAKDLAFLDDAIRPYGIAALENFQLTRRGEALFAAEDAFDDRAFGLCLNEQQRTFRELFHNTTPKIDRMLEAALARGALGGKMNGSGGGGTFFVYAPGKEDEMQACFEPFGVPSHKVSIVSA